MVFLPKNAGWAAELPAERKLSMWGELSEFRKAKEMCQLCFFLGLLCLLIVFVLNLV